MKRLYFKSKLSIFVISVALSMPSLAASFEETQRLANQGNSSAQFNLGVKYERGEGVRQDYQKTFEWYAKAANQGDVRAKYNLGVMYYNGQGVRQNYAKAKDLFGESCDNGYQKGCDQYRDLNQRGY